MEPTKRKCAGTTKKGTPCRASCLTDRDTCLAHADAETRKSMQFIGGGPGSGRPKNPRAVDVLRERIEQDIDRVLNPLWDALDATSGVAVGNGPGATVEIMPDFRTRIAAARELLDRGYGKATQAVEMSGPEGGPVVTSLITDPGLAGEARALLRRAAAPSSD
jgi:hypothetical protein